MRIIQKLVLIAFITILVNTISKAQTNQMFLNQIGMVDSVYSTILKENREIYVHVPETYNPEGKTKYPVAYILDGELFLTPLTVVNQFYTGGFMPEMILVGISNRTNRLRDLTTSAVSELYGMPASEKNGEAENFTQFIEKELIPYVEKNYPVTTYRTLIGHSYGGLFTMYTLMYHSELFENYVAIDPSLDWDNQKVLKDSKALLAKKDFNSKALFMSLSGHLHPENASITIDNVMDDTSDFTLFSRSNLMMSKEIKKNSKNGLSYNWKFYPNDLHGTIVLPSLMDGLISIFDWYQTKNFDRINSPETSTSELRQIISDRAEKLEKHFGYPEPPFPEEILNVLGYMSMDREQVEKAKMYFDFAINFYAESANAYDSMADFYERQQDKKNALKFVTKAFELSGSEYHKKRMEELK